MSELYNGRRGGVTILIMLCACAARPQTGACDDVRPENHGKATTASGSPGAPDAESERSLTKRAIVNASIYDVWWAWTTTEGLASYFAPDSTLELKVDGTWELYMSMDVPEGKRGSEGCKLLAYVPYEMLCFEWTSPPSIPELRDAGILTRVMVHLEEASADKTIVTITHSGHGEGEVWDRNYAYFDKAWSLVTHRLERVFEQRDDAMRRPSPNMAIKEWDTGAVLVRSNDGDTRWQTFEISIPASVGEVWKVLATSAGMKRFMGNRGEPNIELKHDGAYAIWPGATNRVMTFATERMLAVTGSAPEKFPNVRKGGTWGVYMMETAGENQTRLRLCSMGWTDANDEWKEAYDYFLKANVQYLQMLFQHFGGAIPSKPETRTLRWICDVDLPVKDAWDLFTTKAGIESWMVPICEVDFRLGGTIRTNYNADAGIGGPGTIVHHILAYEPYRMYSARFTAPGNAPAAKGVAEKSWGVTTFEARGSNRTRLRLASCGWGEGEEWDQAERFFTWGNRVTLQNLIRKTAEKSVDASRAVAESASGASNVAE